MKASKVQALFAKTIVIVLILSLLTPHNAIFSYHINRAVAEIMQNFPQAATVQDATVQDALAPAIPSQSTMPIVEPVTVTEPTVEPVTKTDARPDTKPDNKQTDVQQSPKQTDMQILPKQTDGSDTSQSPESTEVSKPDPAKDASKSSDSPDAKPSAEDESVERNRSASEDKELSPDADAKQDDAQDVSLDASQDDTSTTESHTRQKRAAQNSTWTTYEDTGKNMKETTWRKVTIPAVTEDRLIKQGHNECKDVTTFQDVWVDKTCSEFQDVWTQKTCTTYQDVYIDYWNDGKGNWGGGKYERRTKQVDCSGYVSQTVQKYCGAYERQTKTTQQCTYKDTSYTQKHIVKPAETRNEVVATRYLTYEQYNSKSQVNKPKSPIGPSVGNTTHTKQAKNNITNRNNRPSHLDLSGCHGGQLEYVEYLWIYTGTCDGKNSLIASQVFADYPSSSFAKRSTERQRELILFMQSAFTNSTKTDKNLLFLDSLKNKQTAQHVFTEARQNSHIMQFLQGLIDACADELTSMLDLVMQTAKMLTYLYNLAKMLFYYVTTGNVAYIQPFLNDVNGAYSGATQQLQGMGQSSVLSAIPQFLNETIQSIKRTAQDYLANNNSSQAAYDIGYQITSIALMVIGPGKAKLVAKLLKGSDKVSDGVKVTNQLTSVKYGDHFKDKSKKQLKPNITYTHPLGYTYKTDSLGRITHAEGELTDVKGDRNKTDQRAAGGSDRECGDHGGHLIACMFGGSGNLDNLVAMDGNLNQSKYAKLERDWKNALKEGKSVKVKITPIYEGNSMRPVRFEIMHKTGNQDWLESKLENKSGG